MCCRRCRVLFGLVWLVWLAALAPGQSSDDGRVRLAREHYQASAMPDRIVLTWSDDPATTQTVNWRTDDSATMPVGEFAEATGGPGFVKQLQQVSATTDKLETSLGMSLYHHVTFRDLKPNTQYVYRVGGDGNWSEFSHFTTASDTPDPFSFVYVGDAQNDVKSHWSRLIRESFRDAPRAKFFLHAGDLVNRANSELEWGEWFYAAGWINRTVPVIATPGNHEYQRKALSQNWRPTFDFPANGPEAFGDTVYYIDVQGVRIVSLNSNEPLEEQVVWLKQVLGGNPHRWTILTFHHPVYSTAKGRDNRELRDKLQPVIDQFQVDLVLQGHDHSYGRTGLVRHAPEADEGDPALEATEVGNLTTGRNLQSERGTVYVVSVSGPKMYDLTDGDRFRTAIANTQLYQIISVDGDTLSYSARSATGREVDSFRLMKRSGMPNQLMESATK